MAANLALLALGLVISFGVLANAAGSWLAFDKSELATRINPFNSAARINTLTGYLNKPKPALEQLEKAAIDGLRYAPSDPRFFSALGVIKKQTGDHAASRKLFSAALLKMPTEIQALRRMYNHAVENSQLKAAARHASVLGRRWPGLWPLVEPNLPMVLSDKRAFVALAEGLGGNAAGRSLLVGSLMRPESFVFANRLLVYWHRRNQTNLEPLIAKVTRALLAAGEVPVAKALFDATVAKDFVDGEALNYNSEFKDALSGNPFDWNFETQPGLDIFRSEERPSAVADQGATPENTEASRFEITLRFGNAPVILKNLTQMLVLEPGKYVLNVRYRGKDLQTPKPIFAVVQCHADGATLARLEFDPTRQDTASLQAEFDVPKENCRLQSAFLANDVRTESWNDRFKGDLIISRFSIDERPSGLKSE